MLVICVASFRKLVPPLSFGAFELERRRIIIKVANFMTINVENFVLLQLSNYLLEYR